MEARHQTPSVMAKLMGLDKEPPQHPVREKQRVFSEKYLQKVASIGFRKKQSSHQHNFFRTRTEGKEEFGVVSKVVETIQRDEHHNLSTGNGKETPALSETRVRSVGQQLFDAETLIEPISSFNIDTTVKSGRIAEEGNLQLLHKINSGLQKEVHGETRLYEICRFAKPQLESKDETFPSKIMVLKPNGRKGEGSLKCFCLPSSCENYHLGSGQLKDFSSHESARLYPEMEEKKKLAYHMESVKQSPRAFSKTSEEVSSQTGDATNGVLDMVSSSLFRGNEKCGKSFEMLNPVSNVSVDENQCSSPFFCSDASYVACQGKNKISQQRDVNTKFQEVRQHGQGTNIHQLLTTPVHGYGARNLVDQSGCSNAKVNLSTRRKAGPMYSSAREVSMARPLCAASVSNANPRTRTKDDILHKYWGLRQNAFSNWSPQESKKQNTNKKDCPEHMNLRDSQIIQHTCLMKDEVMDNKLEDSNMSKQNIASPNSSINVLLAVEKTEVVDLPCGNPKKQQSETTTCNLLGNSDSSSHTSYASIQQETSEFHEEDSVYSLFSETHPDSLGSLEEAYEPSPSSVLEPPFREDISSSSEGLKFVGDNLCDSYEVDNDGQGLNVSSDEDCGDRSVGDFEEKQDFVGFLRAEESRDFSYVVEVLTEAGISNTSLYTDFYTWHSPQCPISPSVFEILEMKFGKQPSWKRSDRRLLFDRINLGFLEILWPCMCIPTWEKPVSRRLNAEPSQDMIEEELWKLLVVEEKEAKKDSADKMLVGEIRWIDLGCDIEFIVIEIVMFLIDELADEIVSLESF